MRDDQDSYDLKDSANEAEYPKSRLMRGLISPFDQLRKSIAPTAPADTTVTDQNLLQLRKHLPELIALKAGTRISIDAELSSKEIISAGLYNSLQQTFNAPLGSSIIMQGTSYARLLHLQLSLPCGKEESCAIILDLELDLGERVLSSGLPAVRLCCCKALQYSSSNLVSYYLHSSCLKALIQALSTHALQRVHYLAELRIASNALPYYLLICMPPSDADYQKLSSYVYLIDQADSHQLLRVMPHEIRKNARMSTFEFMVMESKLSIPQNGLGTGFFGPWSLLGLGFSENVAANT